MTGAGPFLTFITLILAAAIGSLPTGYAAGRLLRGIDVRRLSPHNLGLGTVVTAAGVPALAAAALLDVAKGACAILIARWLGLSGWALAGAGVAVSIGHAYSPLWLVIPPAFARVKGVAVAVGVAAALALTGAISWAALAVPALVAALTVAIPKVSFGGRWGYLSVASVLAAFSAPVVLVVTRASAPFAALALAYALWSLWNHKEHLARIADGVEPRLGERLPLPHQEGEAVCAFLIHPMTIDDFSEALRFRWLGPLRRWGLAPDAAVRWLSRFVRPMKVDDIHPVRSADGRVARVYLIGVPLLPDQIRAEPDLAVRRAVQAAHLAENLGATVLGLGAFWSVVGRKGLDVQSRSRIAITNGGAYTAGSVKMAIPLILARLRARGVEPGRATAAVVGANGVVGFGICRAVVGQVGRLIMVGTNLERLERSRELLQRRHPSTAIDATADLDALRDADVIFTATSDPAPVIFPRHVREGTIVLDLGRPADVDASVAAMPKVEVIPGGVVRLPGDPKARLDIGYGLGLVPACLAETVILALDGSHERVSLGDRTKAEHVDYFVTRGAQLGFDIVTGPQAIPQPERQGRDAAAQTA